MDGDVKPAPCRQRLRLFGGDMNIEQFRSASGSCAVPPRRDHTRKNTRPMYEIVRNGRPSKTIKKKLY